ncbi:MAG: TetR/AcrR family transcriptional regulator [Pseudomonadales bacterium]
MGRNSISDVRKPEILKTFIKVINEEGLAKASIAKVAKRMESFPSLIQHYFGSRENLVLELIDFLLEDYAQFYHSRIDAYQDPQEKDQAILDLIFSLEWGGLDGQLVYLDLFTMGLRDEKIRVGVLRMNDMLRNFLREDLSMFKQGKIQNEEPLLNHIVFLLEGFHMWGFNRSPKEHRAIAEQQQRLVLSLLEVEADKAS